MIIYVDTPFKKEHKVKLLAGVGYDDVFFFKDELKNEKEQLAALLKADILLGNPRPASWLAKATNLKWLQLYSTGFEYYEGIDIPAVKTNMQDYYSQPTAETAVAGIMALYRGMDTFSLLKAESKWVGYPVRFGLQVLMNKKAIILGPGNIGKRIAKILGGFDCDISFYGRSSALASIKTKEQLAEQLPAADLVICCLPGTEQTKGFFTKDLLACMKTTAIFCNVGRGNLLADENDLADALTEKRIGGAVLDVTAEEPLPVTHRFWNCPNTILTQHSGGGVVTEYDGIADFFLENFAAFKAGEPLKNRIEFTRGY